MKIWLKKGQVFFVSMMVAVVFIILALALAPALIQSSNNAQNATYDSGRSQGLDCSNSSNSNFIKADCLVVDYQAPFFVGFLIFAAGAIIAAKILI